MRLAIIPARSGSKGLKDKNILPLFDKPLLAHSIEQARKSKLFDTIICSTDSKSYAQIARDYGASVIMRDSELSGDKSPSSAFIAHALASLKSKGREFEFFCLLQPTSPLRRVEDITASFALFGDDVEFVVSFLKSKTPQLIHNLDDISAFRIKDYARQNFDFYTPNGAIYWARSEAYLRELDFFSTTTKAYVMDRLHSVDIDDKLDFDIALNLFRQLNSKELLASAIAATSAQLSSIMNFSSTAKIAILGHSIMANYPYTEIKSQKCLNLAINGSDTKDCINLVKKLEKLSEKIYIMQGSNDIVKDQSLEKIGEDLKSLLNLCKNKGAKELTLLATPNTILRLDRENKKINALNEIYAKIAKASGTRFLKVGALNKDGALNLAYTYDGLHLNSKGYEILKKIIEDA